MIIFLLLPITAALMSTATILLLTNVSSYPPPTDWERLLLNFMYIGFLFLIAKGNKDD